MEYDDDCDNYDDMQLSLLNICIDIFNNFTDLITLVMCESSYENCARLCLDNDHSSFSSFRSSTLRILNVKIQSFDDCLDVLDGRFDQLHTLIVDLANVNRPYKIPNQVSFTKYCY